MVDKDLADIFHAVKIFSDFFFFKYLHLFIYIAMQFITKCKSNILRVIKSNNSNINI